MKKTREQNGITLLALIITIIILLILAVVTINAIKNGDIITYAQSAREKSEMAQIKEEAELVKSEGYIEYSMLDGDLSQSKLLELISEHFEGSTKKGRIITTEDEKYDIVIDEKLNIIVLKHGEMTVELVLDKTEMRKALSINEQKPVKDTLKVTLNNFANDSKLIWTSSNENVVEIEGNGTIVDILIKTAGTSTIMVTCDQYSATCLVKADYLETATLDTIVTTNSTIDGEMYSSTNPVIPAGFKAINTAASSWDSKDGLDVDKGLVISDGNSEFVWVPVSEINDMIMCQEHGASVNLDEVTLQCPICGDNTKLAGKLYAYGNSFSSTITEQNFLSYREPDVVTEADFHYLDDGTLIQGDTLEGTGGDYNHLSTVLEGKYAQTQNVASFKAQLQNEFDNMAKSVAKYEGFYVGRYEMSLTSGKTAQSRYGATSANSSQSTTYMWYGLYTKCKTYISTKKSVQSTMIWGSQWDAMLKWMANGDDAIVRKGIRDSRNRTRVSGNTATDVLNNIYDLYGNSYEFTLESQYGCYRISRGGCAQWKDVTAPATRSSSSNYTDPEEHFSLNGSRLALYLF